MTNTLLGLSNIKAMELGETPVSKLYLGDILVWGQSQPVPEDKVTFTVQTIPADAVVTMTAGGVDTVTKSIKVDKNTAINYRIERDGYEPMESAIFMGENSESVTITMSALGYATLTINPKPSQADVIISADGYTSVTGKGLQHLTVAKGTNVTFTAKYTNPSTGEVVDEMTLTLPLANDVILNLDLTVKHYQWSLGFQSQDTQEFLTSYAEVTTTEGTYIIGPVLMQSIPFRAPVDTSLSYKVYTKDYEYTGSGTASKVGGSTTAARPNKLLTITCSPADAVVSVKDVFGSDIPMYSRDLQSGITQVYQAWYGSGRRTLYISAHKEGYQPIENQEFLITYNTEASLTLNLTSL